LLNKQETTVNIEGCSGNWVGASLYSVMFGSQATGGTAELLAAIQEESHEDACNRCRNFPCSRQRACGLVQDRSGKQETRRGSADQFHEEMRGRRHRQMRS